MNNRTMARELARKYRQNEELSLDEEVILHDACSNSGQMLDNIGHMAILIDIVEKHLNQITMKDIVL